MSEGAMVFNEITLTASRKKILVIVILRSDWILLIALTKNISLRILVKLNKCVLTLDIPNLRKSKKFVILSVKPSSYRGRESIIHAIRKYSMSILYNIYLRHDL